MGADQPPPPPPPPRDDRRDPETVDKEGSATESAAEHGDSLDRGVASADSQDRVEAHFDDRQATRDDRPSDDPNAEKPEPKGLEPDGLRPSPEMQQHLDEFKERKAARTDAAGQEQRPDTTPAQDEPPQKRDDPTGPAQMPGPVSETAMTQARRADGEAHTTEIARPDDPAFVQAEQQAHAQADRQADAQMSPEVPEPPVDEARRGATNDQPTEIAQPATHEEAQINEAATGEEAQPEKRVMTTGPHDASQASNLPTSDLLTENSSVGDLGDDAHHTSGGDDVATRTVADVPRGETPPVSDQSDSAHSAVNRDAALPKASEAGQDQPASPSPPASRPDTSKLPQTKDIVFVGGDPLMQSEIIDHLSSHGFENDSIQFDPDRLHQAREMDPKDMAERMKAGNLTVIDLGASPTGDTIDNIAANGDREALEVPQLKADGSRVPGSGSYSPEGVSPSYLPLYETMDNTDSAVTTGQTMNRVRQHANATGAGTFEPPSTNDPHAQYAMNVAWMGDLMVNNPRTPTDPSKSAVDDLGANPTAKAPSGFVAAEGVIAEGLGVLRK